MSVQPEATVVLRRDGVGLVLRFDPPSEPERLPQVLHWGADPGDAPLSYVDPPAGLSPLPTREDWAGRPGVSGDRAGKWPHLRLRRSGPPAIQDTGEGPATVTLTAADETAGVSVQSEWVLSAEGVLRVRHSLTNTGPDEWRLAGLRTVLPIAEDAVELLDFTGRWALERVPQRHEFTAGAHVRENRRGRTGFDANLLVAGTTGFGFRTGQVWGVHCGWSGNHEHTAERHPDSPPTLAGGELLDPGEVRLGPGASYQTPWVYFVYSATGLDGLSDRLHRMLRARPGHPRSPRPLTLNVWEAVYFDHRLPRLIELADRAAEIGVERYVLDDGWFRHRRDDHAGLGDWYVDETVWPDGLHPLVDHVHERGMQFGLWFEPEMVNPDSDVARAHPDWILAAPDRWPVARRNQQVLDVARPEVTAYLLERIDAVLSEYRIDYVKWDHNRDLVEALHHEAAGVHAQTRAVYALIDELRARHPGLEIESCSSGGARVDLGILERTDRVWGSDSNDPIDRQAIQRWTALLIPLELIGAHVGANRTHVTGRTTELAFRCATALFGHAGIEWDITTCTPEELSALRRWIELYRRLRELLHSGQLVRADLPDPTAALQGVVARDARHAVYSYAQLTSPAPHGPYRFRLPGLDPALRYRVVACPELDQSGPIEWGVVSGAALSSLGLGTSRLRPGEALLLELRAQ